MGTDDVIGQGARRKTEEHVSEHKNSLILLGYLGEFPGGE